VFRGRKGLVPALGFLDLRKEKAKFCSALIKRKYSVLLSRYLLWANKTFARKFA
jgi:hypothetical protein